MTEAQTILDMIETVEPADTEKLDEIDARGWCWLYNGEYIRHIGTDHIIFKDKNLNGTMHLSGVERPRYTRSRDALKAIRPEGWQYRMVHDMGSDVWQCSLTLYGPRCEILESINQNWKFRAKTEELAELHAIIQAIEHERTK